MTDAPWPELAFELVCIAEQRGGSGYTGTDYVRLNPPGASGEAIELEWYDTGTATVSTGFTFQLMVGSTDTAELIGVVVAIMDGRATEAAEVAQDGTWLRVSTEVRDTDGGHWQTSMRSALNTADLPVHHVHRRQIARWATE
jgi:hypothetical protein